MPKIGPFKAMAFNNPTPQTEELYFKSINTTVDQYRAFLEEVRMHSCFPIVIWMMASDQGRGILADRRHVCQVAGQAVRAEVRSDLTCSPKFSPAKT